MNVAIVLAVFPVIFVGELPDKTMFASLVLASPRQATRGLGGSGGRVPRPCGHRGDYRRGPLRAALSPRVDVFVAVLFAAGAVYAFWEANREDEEELVTQEALTHRRVLTTAFVVIFVAEWGDLTRS